MDINGATALVHDSFRDGQSQARSCFISDLRFVGPEKTVENRVEVIFLNDCSVVGYVN